MQKLYKTALQRILTKIGADKLQILTVENLQTALKDKNIPLSEIDQTIFHKLPREEIKNLVRNPCAINNANQTDSQIVTNGKAVRGALNIVEKKICFKCPFVGSCDKAFIEPKPDYQLQSPLQNLLISMKNISEVEANDKIKNRSWFSGVRVCDSLNSVIEDLMQGGQQFKIFKAERNKLRDEAEAGKQNQDQTDQKQVVKSAKKNKVPLKDVYAQVPTTKKPQDKSEKEGEEAFEQLSKGPQNIFKKKKSDQFIKIAQKYLNQDKESSLNQNNKQKKSSKPKRQEIQDEQQQRRPKKKKRQFKDNQEPQTKYRQKNQYKDRKPYQNQRNKSFRDQEDQRDTYQSRKQSKFNQQQNYRDRNQPQRSERKWESKGYSEEENPKIRRMSKERPQQNRNERKNFETQERPSRSSGKVDKFYTEMRNDRSDEQEILAQLNKRDTRPKETRLPRDAKYSSQEGMRTEGRRDFTEKEMQQFQKLEKIPKILKTEFASKQDLKQRAQQDTESGEGERKGRRVKRA